MVDSTSVADSPLILASGSPRRRELMQSAGYTFTVMVPDPAVECGICSGQSPAEYVAQLAFRKARFIAERSPEGMIVAADTVAVCKGQVLGKPRDRDHARQMLTMLAGTNHLVLTGLCLWQMPQKQCAVDVAVTRLQMEAIDEMALEDYLQTDLWDGKAGAFGYQDGNDWLRVIEGSESNVVGLPMERLAEMLANFPRIARSVETQ